MSKENLHTSNKKEADSFYEILGLKEEATLEEIKVLDLHNVSHVSTSLLIESCLCDIST